MNFISTSIRLNSILIIEPNLWHSETLIGFAKYFLDLGYNVDILCRESVFSGKVFCRFLNDRLQFYQWEPECFSSIVSDPKLQKYRIIMLNTLFFVNLSYNESYLNMLKINVGEEKIFLVEHKRARYTESQMNIISLNDFSGHAMVNPHFFGNIDFTPKNDIPHFICVGNIEAHRRNYNLLFSAVQELKNAKIDFKIVLVGSTKKVGHPVISPDLEFHSVVPSALVSYIEFKGRLDYEKMYCEMERADFFLALLDPDDIEHEKYITTCSSGAIQLVYGFAKPAIIHQKFASAYHLDTKNSVVYQKNLAAAMKLACHMTKEEYADKQQSLLNVAKKIEAASLNNLSVLLNNLPQGQNSDERNLQIFEENAENYAVKISVIIPCYNSERFLSECLDSVLSQTLYDIEVICVDDGSTDGTLEMLYEYGGKDSRIRVLTQKNQYAGVARNTGMDVATGKYMIFLDSDDFFEPVMLEKMYEKSETDNADICVCGTGIYDNATEQVICNEFFRIRLNLLPPKTPFSPHDISENILRFCTPSPWSFFRTRFIKEHSIRFQPLKQANDMFFTRTALILSKRITIVDQCFVYYRKGNFASITESNDDRAESLYKAQKALKEILVQKNLYQEFSKAFLDLALIRAIYALSITKTKQRWLETALFLKNTYFKYFNLPNYPNSVFMDENAYKMMVLITRSNDKELEEYEPFFATGVVEKYVAFTFPLDDSIPVKVSVIIPVYNGEKYIEECICSVLRQSLNDIEVICIDDGSTDSSLKIMKKLAEKDKRIVIFEQENQGQGAARNKGIEVAKGEYVFFLDSDDLLVWCALDHMYRKAKYHHLDCLLCEAATFYSSIELYWEYPQYYNMYRYKENYSDISTGSELLRHMLERNEFTAFTCTCLFLRKFLRENNIFFSAKKNDNDVFFLENSLNLAERAWIHKEPLYFKRILQKPKKVKMKVQNPKVSIIIPVYNVEKYLRECLDSVVKQTLQEIEIICVNDCSTDDSLKVLKEYTENDKRIIVIDNKENRGAAAARNQMLEIASGEYVGFVDSDDFIDPNFYEILYTEAKKQNADLARTTCLYYYSSNLKIPNYLNKTLVCKAHAGQDLNMNDHSAVIWDAIYRRDYLSKNNIFFDVSQKYSEDIIFVAKTTFYSSKSIPVLGTSYNYRRFWGNERTQHLSFRGKIKIDNFINVQMSGVVFLNSVVFDDKNDYIIAYKRFLRRFDFRFVETAKMVNVEEHQKLFNAFVLAFNLFKCKSELENESYYKYLLNNKFKDYLYTKQNPELIISLTSGPGKINIVDQVIETLLKQTKKAGKVILWLASMQFPNKETDIPLKLLALTDHGLTISYTNEDIKSYNKLIPALEEYPNSIIVTVDDNILYPQDLIGNLYAAYKDNPKMVHSVLMHRMTFKNGQLRPFHEWQKQKYDDSKPSYLNFPISSGGVLYPPGTLHSDVTKKKLFIKLASLADDIWFWAMAVKQDTKINYVQEANFEIVFVEDIQDNNKLCKENIEQSIEDIQLMAVIKHYSEVFKKIKKESIKDVNDGKNPTKIDNRDFFGKMRRKFLKVVFGRELVNNIIKIDQIGEIMNVNMESMNKALTNMENVLAKRIEDLNLKIDGLNQSVDVFCQRTSDLNKERENLNENQDN